MIFNSTEFLVFFCLVFILYYGIQRKGWQLAVLLVSSLVFYGWNSPNLEAAIAKDNTVPRLDDATAGRLRRLTGYAEEVRLSAEKRKLMTKHLDEAPLLIANLQRRGARVVLFEMPIDRRAQKGGRELAAWQLIREKFADGEFSWLRMPDRDWKTQDLVHMYPESAKQLASALEDELVTSVAMKDRRAAL